MEQWCSGMLPFGLTSWCVDNTSQVQHKQDPSKILKTHRHVLPYFVGLFPIIRVCHFALNFCLLGFVHTKISKILVRKISIKAELGAYK